MRRRKNFLFLVLSGQSACIEFYYLCGRGKCAVSPVDRHGRKRRTFMKRLKEYFNVIVTAVICFFIGLAHEKGVHGEMVKVPGNGYAAGSETRGMSGCREDVCRGHKKFHMSKIRNMDCVKNRKGKRPRLRNVFFWLGGPGDRPHPEPKDSNTTYVRPGARFSSA